MHKYSKKQIVDILESEGLEYAVLYYLDANSISDAEIREAWKTAAESLRKLETLLGLDR